MKNKLYAGGRNGKRFPRWLPVFFVLMLQFQALHAQENLKVLQDQWVHFKDAPNALYKHLTGEAYTILEQRDEEIGAISSLAEWKSRQEFIRQKLSKVLGPFPEKNPLNPQITRTVEKEDFKVEHVVYESQPGFYVSASLFVPKKRKGKSPAVIYCSGHAAEGYRSDTYQHVILNLVKKGFIVLAFDPVGQGERLEYWDEAQGKSTVGSATREHSYPGAQAFVSGSSQAKHMIWDGIRAVDYLLTRKEVDPDRIGITGRSGGGTQSSYIAAVDERIYAAAPENYLTNFRRLFETNGAQDAEQNFLHGIAEGLDHPDLLIVRAPKPSMLIATTRDIFNIEGARETAEQVSRIYEGYGSPDNFEIVEDDAGHASTLKNREAMYAFFQHHLKNPGNSKDEAVDTLSAEEIQVTKTGQISTSFGGETVYSLNKKEAEKLLSWKDTENQRLESNADKLKVAKTLSGYRAPQEAGKPVLTGRYQREGYRIETNYIKGEGDYILPYLLFSPENPNGKALIYLHPRDKSADAAEGGEIEWFVKSGYTVLAPDMLGVGELGGDFRGDSYFEGSSYNLWFTALQIGRSIVGVQAADVIKLSRTLLEGSNIKEIYALAKKEMGPVLLHAAAFEPMFAGIALVEPLLSYESVVMNRFYKPSHIHSTVAAALRSYDLSDLAGGLAPTKLLMVNIQQSNGESAGPEQREIAYVKSVYQYRNAENQLDIRTKKAPGGNFEHYKNWIK